MSVPDHTHQLLIHIGDGATPTEAFTWLCGAKARSVTFKNNLGEDEVLDCADPTGSVAVIQRFLQSQDTTLQISGKVAKSAIPTLRAWADTGAAKNIRIVIDELLADNGGYWSLAAFCETLELSQDSAQDSTAFTATIMGSGTRSWTAAAA